MATTVSSVTNGPFTLLPGANRGAALFTERSLQPIPLVLPCSCAWLWNTVLPPHLLTSHGTTFVRHSRVWTEFPPSPRAQNHRSTSFVGKIRIDCDCNSTEFHRVARNENYGKKKKLKTESLTVLILWIQERGEGIGRKSKGRVKTSSPRSLFKYSKQLPTTMRCYHLENGGENAGEIRGRGEKGRKQGA